MKSTTFNICLFIISSFVLMSCVQPVSTPDPLENRFLQFIKIKESGEFTLTINGNSVSFYNEFLSDTVKKDITEKIFYSRMNVNLSHVSIKNIEYSENGRSAVIYFKCNLKYKGYTLKRIVLTSDWVLENNKWMYLMELNNHPFQQKKSKIKTNF